jgi:hypothetical protein
MWINKKMLDKAKRANLIKFLQENYPELIYEKEPGVFAYTKRNCIKFFKGDDGYYRFCDHALRKHNQINYFGDSITFLIDYVGGYTFETATLALLEFAEREKE